MGGLLESTIVSPLPLGSVSGSDGSGSDSDVQITNDQAEGLVGTISDVGFGAIQTGLDVTEDVAGDPSGAVGNLGGSIADFDFEDGYEFETINGSGSSDGTQEGSTSGGSGSSSGGSGSNSGGSGSSSGSGSSGGSTGGESSPSGGLVQPIVLPSGSQGEGGIDTLALVGIALVGAALLYAATEGF